jgi:hypothetical protein
MEESPPEFMSNPARAVLLGSLLKVFRDLSTSPCVLSALAALSQLSESDQELA